MLFIKKRIILIAALIVYTIGGIFNTGYYYYDEHYQLIEFAELKTGNNTPSDLAWEYEAKIRPSLQPAIAYLFFSIMRSINLTDPYFLMILLRVLTALFAIGVITYFIKMTQSQIIPDFLFWYKVLAYFLWFIPFINTRFSSESYSGLIFLFSIGFFYSSSKNKYFLIGCLWGVSFLFRFQTAFMAFGYISWLIFIQKINVKIILKILGGGCLVLTIGFLLDYWFYGSPTLTYSNYYVSNVIDDVASGYGVSPWYFYFTESVTSTIIPIGIVIWFCIFTLFFSDLKNLICWITLPFLIIHFLTPHKELRFLFPLVNLIPLFIILSIQKLAKLGGVLKRINYNNMTLVIAMITINTCALIITMFSPADDYGRMNITQAIHNRYEKQNVILWVVKRSNPYNPIPVHQSFYLDRNVDIEPFHLDSTKLVANTINLIVVKSSQVSEYKPFFNSYKLVKLKTGVPDWIKKAKDLIGYDIDPLSLYEITRDK